MTTRDPDQILPRLSPASWGALALGISLLAALGVLAARLARPEAEYREDGSLEVAELLGNAAAEGYARAVEPREFRFPEDHGPHPEFRTEWWYFTGNLEAEGGRRFGFQLTFFRNALAPEAPEGSRRASPWASRRVYMAHFAVTDAAGERFFHFERFARGAAGLAGARAPEPAAEGGAPWRVWLGDWCAEGSPVWPLRLRAAARDDKGPEVALDLTLRPGKPPVLQGEAGLSRKGPEPGNASYYYSHTRMPAAGALRLGGDEVAVAGLAWLDREWSTSALGEGQVGWDWFSLQLDDDRELMYYRLRRADGSTDPLSQGSLVAPDGSSRPLAAGDVTLEVLARWRSPESGALYPARWRLRVPAVGLDLTLTPLVANQELRGTVRYWEGAVKVEGTRRGPSGIDAGSGADPEPARGLGYVELTGYGP